MRDIRKEAIVIAILSIYTRGVVATQRDCVYICVCVRLSSPSIRIVVPLLEKASVARTIVTTPASTTSAVSSRPSATALPGSYAPSGSRDAAQGLLSLLRGSSRSRRGESDGPTTGGPALYRCIVPV
ncbi:hypothetical protein ACS0PU_012741 [Formica fusca]